jgi:hypothetical protein
VRVTLPEVASAAGCDLDCGPRRLEVKVGLAAAGGGGRRAEGAGGLGRKGGPAGRVAAAATKAAEPWPLVCSALGGCGVRVEVLGRRAWQWRWRDVCCCVARQVPGRYRLDVPLPHTVEDGKGRAKFDKARRQLEVTLPVLPPPPPPPSQQQQQEKPGAAQPDGLCGDEAEAPGGHEEPAAPESCGGRKGQRGGECGSDVQPEADQRSASRAAAAEAKEEGATQRDAGAPSGAEGAGAAAAGADARELLENERRWRELHAKQHPAEASASPAEEATGPAVAAAEEGEAKPAPAATAAEAAPAVAATAVLQPRLRASMAMELD